MMTYKNILCLLVMAFHTTMSMAQGATQTIKGEVKDKISNTPLPGANVVVLDFVPLTGTTTDVNGKFKITALPIGTYSIKISHMGYNDCVVKNVLLNAGKETVMTIMVEEKIVQANEVVVTDRQKKSGPKNDAAAVSTRTFSVEETQKFAAAVNDPARMAVAFAGVVSTDDGNNAISIRGNSPQGLLWRMEGVDIPNPNHFAGVATSGGGISILSAQLLGNSDFMTGAFPAEYGNALSGVFDLRLRKGNNEKREHTIQAGFLGLDFATEGPLNKKNGGSYLVNYRYSTLSVLDKIGVPVGDAVTNFQDLSFHVDMPTPNTGVFSLFGFAGLSTQNFNAKKDSVKWKSNFDRYNWAFTNSTAFVGINHVININANTFIKSSANVNFTGKKYFEDRLDAEYHATREVNQDFDEGKINLRTAITSKLNARHNIKAGIMATVNDFELKHQYYDNAQNVLLTAINNQGSTVHYNAYIQHTFKINERTQINSGIHYMMLRLNNTYALEPRVNIRHNFGKQYIAFGYGLHSQLQPLGLYFTQHNLTSLNVLPNKNLEFTKAHHIVTAYGLQFTDYLHIKVEAYYQHLYDVPVAADTSDRFSALNLEGMYPEKELTNNGHGRNYGLEFTVEQFLHNGFYLLYSTSIFNSQFEASNGAWFNTRYNTNFAATLTGGKEIKLRSTHYQKTLGVNVKTIVAGGKRNIPINKASSDSAGYVVYDFDKMFAKRERTYFRTDLKVSYKINRSKSTTTWSLDLQNATNTQNIFGEYYDPLTKETKIWKQMPMIPVFSYKIDF